MSFPPLLAFPHSIDSDRTLFLVYNTTESVLTTDSPAYGQVITIKPVGDDEPEIWADNGFANIDGEIIYYDSVAKNSGGKVYKLLQCGRGLGGTKSKSNTVGTEIRSYNIAQHHNRLVDATIATEIRISEIDQKLDRLLQEDPCEDDSSLCPDVQLDIEIVASDGSCQGVQVNYDLRITGNFTSFRIDFGDGTSTTTSISGTHVYPPNSSIDPIATVENNTCQIVQTAAERRNPNAPPKSVEPEPLHVTVPVEFDVNINIPELAISHPAIEFPQLIQPCISVTPIDLPQISIGDISISVPDYISIDNPNIPSEISFVNIPDFGPVPGEISVVVPEIPTIEFGEAPTFPNISFLNPPTFPTTIEFGEAPTIQFGDIPTIEFGNVPSFGPISVVGGVIPTEIALVGNIPAAIPVVGAFPTSIAVTMASDFPTNIDVTDSIPTNIAVTDEIPDSINVMDDIPDTIQVVGSIPSSIGISGDIPTEITVAGGVSVDWGSAPTVGVEWGSPPTVSCVVTVECPGGGAGFQSTMNHEPFGLEVPGYDFEEEEEKKDSDSVRWGTTPTVGVNLSPLGIPSEIKIVPPTYMPDEILMRLETPLPDKIDILLQAPENIPLSLGELKDGIQLVAPENLPDINVVGIPDEINVVGMPSTITVDVKMPSEIEAKLTVPENLEVPLVYKGGPIPVQFAGLPNDSDSDDGPCFRLVQCQP